VSPGKAAAEAIVVETASTLLVADGRDILRVDIATGDRSVAYSVPGFVSRIKDIIVESPTSVLVLEDPDGVSRLSPGRLVVSSTSVGTGNFPMTPWGIERDRATGDVLVHSLTNQNIVIAELATGNRTTWSGTINFGPGQVGAGPAIFHWGMAVDPDIGVAYSTLKTDVVYRTDPTTRDRTVLSRDGEVGSGPAIAIAEAIAVGAGGVVYVLNRTAGEILAIDPATGNRTLVASGSLGTGPTISTSNPMSGDSVFYMAVGQSVSNVDGWWKY
jgi:hypothetical protein